jgi:hypothetical protein
VRRFKQSHKKRVRITLQNTMDKDCETMLDDALRWFQRRDYGLHVAYGMLVVASYATAKSCSDWVRPLEVRALLASVLLAAFGMGAWFFMWCACDDDNRRRERKNGDRFFSAFISYLVAVGLLVFLIYLLAC